MISNPDVDRKLRADLIVANAGEIITCARTARDTIGRLTGGWLAVAGDRIVAIGSRDKIMETVDMTNARVIDASGKVIAPGFVDCHTHLVFEGSRVNEYVSRLTEGDRKSPLVSGIRNGVMTSVSMTRQASKMSLFKAARTRLARMLEAGTTTVEIKSGYGLTTSSELKLLIVNSWLSKDVPIDIINTFMGAHICPCDISWDVYLDTLIHEMIPWVSGLGLAAFCDVWCDEGQYGTSEAARILTVAADAGLRPRIHTDAYSYIGGSELAAELRVASADHLNYTPIDVIKKLAGAGVPGVLLPASDFALNHPRPANARAMIDSGMTIALGTDLCPSCWTESMQFVTQLACLLYRISPAEALRAATLGGAVALGLQDDRGSLEPGKLADFQIWDVPSFEHVVYRLGANVVESVFKRGKEVVRKGRFVGDGLSDQYAIAQ